MLSFIVPAHNEEAWIGRCLAAIRESIPSGEDAEIIVADDASTDRTAEVATEHGARVIHVERRQISAARNAGAREARGEIFFFVDADTLVNAEVVQCAIAATNGGAAGGGFIPKFEGQIPLWFRLAYPFLVFVMRHIRRQTGGALLFCTRPAFETVGGFSEMHFAAEEDIWIRALKRHGHFVIPRPTIITSGRNLRNQSAWAILRILLRLALRGPNAFRNREGLDIWYQPRRERPEDQSTR